MADNDKQYSSVSDMLRSTLESDSTAPDEFDQLLKQREVIKQLIVLRVTKNRSQAEIADSMGCSQSCVSKLENSIDDDLTFAQFRKYLHALGFEPAIGCLPENRSTVDEIKILAIGIKRRLDRLAHIARGDDLLAEGIAQFYAEAFLNFNKFIADSASRLPHRPDGNGPYIQFFTEVLSIIDGQSAPNEIAKRDIIRPCLQH